MIRIFSNIAILALSFAFHAGAAPTTGTTALLKRQDASFSVDGEVTALGLSAADFICLGLTGPLTEAFSEYLKNVAGCSITPMPNSSDGDLDHASCEVESNPTGSLAAVLDGARQNCENAGGVFDEQVF